MSTKLEKMLEYLVNEEMDKAHELFHEFVVEKSKGIYENLIAEEEEDEEEEMDESVDEDGEEEVDENFDMESTFETDDGEDDLDLGADDDMGNEMPSDEFGGDATDDLGADTMDMGGEGSEAKDIIADAISELEQLLSQMDGEEGGDDMGDEEGGEFDGEMDSEFGDEETDDEDEGMYMEGRRITREYTEKVGNDWDKGSTQKGQGQIVGANTGEKMPNATDGRSPISSGKGKPTTGATAGNILGDQKTGAGTNTGTSPAKHQKGINPESGEKFASGLNNVDGKKSGVKTLSKVAGGHGAEKKGAGPGPVGSGSGDKAGQTSIAPETKKQFLPPHSK